MENNYYNFALNDYTFVMVNYDEKRVYNGMCTLSQKVCEHFMKHIIEKYYEPDTSSDILHTNEIMRTHDLIKLGKFLEENLDITFNENLSHSLQEANEFYYKTEYPGDGSFFVNADDVETAVNAIKLCKEMTDRVIAEKEFGQNRETDYDYDK